MDSRRSIRFKRMWAENRDRMCAAVSVNLLNVNQQKRLAALRGGEIPEGYEEFYRALMSNKQFRSAEVFQLIAEHHAVRGSA